MQKKNPRDLEALLSPRSIAIVGASEGPRHGGEVMRSLRSSGFAGELIPVNPRYREVYGIPCHASLDAIGRPVECVVLAVNREQVCDQLRRAATLGVRAAVIVSGGFRETGESGARIERELSQLAREFGIRCLGPNTIGFINVTERVGCYSASLPQDLRPGSIAAVVQSGTVCGAVGGAARGIGYSYLVSTGNETDVDTAELIDYLVDDPSTHVIMAFAESISRPRAFMQAAARAWTARKPIVLLRVGLSESGQRMAASHTGALAGSAKVHRAMTERYGIIAVETMNEMLAVAELCAACLDRLPKAGGLAMMTHSGGEAALFLDRCAAVGLDMQVLSPTTVEALRRALPAIAQPGNPLDVTGVGAVDGDVFEACLSALVGDSGVGMVAVMQDVRRGHWVLHQAARRAAEVARGATKPIIFFSNTTRVFDPELDETLAAARIPLVYGTEETVRAATGVLRYARSTPVAAPKPAPAPSPEARRLLTEAIDEVGSKRLLVHYGLPSLRERACVDVASAVEAAAAIGYPVALKILSPDILHKTEAGGVTVGIQGPEPLRAAAEEMLARVRASRPRARISGFLVQELVIDPVAEMILGVTIDPHAGPAVLCGMGGIFAEILDDTAVALAPIDDDAALGMIQRLRCWPILAGARGRPAADTAALASTLAALSRAAHELADDVLSIDVNPLMVLEAGRGARMVDAFVEHRS